MAPKWKTNITLETARLSDEDLQKARKLFFLADKDNSGSIDVEELSFLMESLGQEASQDDIKKLIASVDGVGGADSDGQIQLREFFKLYANSLNRKSSKSDTDAKNVLRCAGGDAVASVKKEAINELLHGYGLGDLDEAFEDLPEDLGLDAMKSILAVQ